MHLVTVRSTASDFERESLLASLARLIPASSLPGSPSNPEDCPLFVLVGLRTADDDNDNDSPTLPQPFSFRGLSPRALARLRRPPCLSIPSIPSLRAALAADPIFSARDIVFVNLIGAHLASKDAHLASAKALFDSLCLLINFILLPAKRSNPSLLPTRPQTSPLLKRQVAKYILSSEKSCSRLTLHFLSPTTATDLSCFSI